MAVRPNPADLLAGDAARCMVPGVARAPTQWKLPIAAPAAPPGQEADGSRGLEPPARIGPPAAEISARTDDGRVWRSGLTADEYVALVVAQRALLRGLHMLAPADRGFVMRTADALILTMPAHDRQALVDVARRYPELIEKGRG